MEEDTVTLAITHVELELIDALVVTAIARLDESITHLRVNGDFAENEEIYRLMRSRYAAINRRLDLLRDPFAAMGMVPAWTTR